MQRTYLWLADLILITHVLIVLFILVGFVLIWIGYFRNWNFVRNFYFRIAHLVAMGFVTVQTILGASCPLTIWENALRMKAGADPHYEETFIGHWLGKLLFFEISLEVFAILYGLFFVLVLWTFFFVKPRRPLKKRH